MVKIVYYDLDTTGGGRNRDHEIIEIAAKYNDEEFFTYIYPTGPISARATAYHGFSKDGLNRQLSYRGRLFETVSPNEGFQEFLDFLDEVKGHSERVVLCSHTNRTFDSVRKYPFNIYLHFGYVPTSVALVNFKRNFADFLPKLYQLVAETILIFNKKLKWVLRQA